MKRMILALGFVALPALAAAQTTTDDSPSTENWWDQVGAAFFSDEALVSARPEYEVRAQWTGLSEDDQAALKARCEALATGTAVSSQSSEDGMTDDRTGTPGVGAGPDATNSEAAGVEGDEFDAGATGTTVTGDEGTIERQRASVETTEPGETGLAGQGGASNDPEVAQMVPVCDLIRSF